MGGTTDKNTNMWGNFAGIKMNDSSPTRGWRWGQAREKDHETSTTKNMFFFSKATSKGKQT